MNKKERYKNMNGKKERKITLVEASVLLVISIVLIYMNARKWGIGTGLSILGVGMFLAAYSMIVLRISWEDINKEILKVFQTGMGATLILLMVGFIGSSWTVSGTNPMLIYFGLKLISPALYYAVAFILPAVLGVATGSAWAIISSVGVALFGVGVGLGVNPAVAAAAIASGAYVGDKWSPFSDVPNLAGASNGHTSFEVFKAQLPVEIPALVLTVAAYLIMGFRFAGGSADLSVVDEILGCLEGVYHFNILLLLPPVIVIGGAFIKMPIIPCLALSSLVAVAEGSLFQGEPLTASFNVLYSGVTADTGNELIDALLSGGGLSNMMSLILIIFCAFIFAGIIERMGLLNVILKDLSKVARSHGMIVLYSMITSVLTVFLTASVYVSTILNARIWGNVYKKSGMSTLMLARVTDEGMSNWGMIVPWSSGVAVVCGAFGVTLGQYLPFLFSTWFGMGFTLLWGFLKRYEIAVTQEELEEMYETEAAAE